MDNYLLTGKSKELLEKSIELGYSETYFSEDFVIVKAASVKELNSALKKTKKKVILVPLNEDVLRFAIEKTKIFGVMGLERIHYKDSMHYLRSGIDQIVAKFMKEKIYFVSLADILSSRNQARLMARISANIMVCKKYKVEVVFSTFASSIEGMRLAKDMEAFGKVIEMKEF